jgi:hypothetical protein
MWLRASPFTDFKVDGRHLLGGGPRQLQVFWLQVTCNGREKADCNHARSIVTPPMHIGLKNSIKYEVEKRWSRVVAASCIKPLKTTINLSCI